MSFTHMHIYDIRHTDIYLSYEYMTNSYGYITISTWYNTIQYNMTLWILSMELMILPLTYH